MSYFKYSATGLPSWLTLDGNTGELSGTPTDATPVSCELTVTTADGMIDSFTWHAIIEPNPLVAGSGTLPSQVQEGSSYSGALGFGGYAVPPFTIDAVTGTIPSWLNVSTQQTGTSGTATFNGTAQNPGTVTFTPRITDSSNPPQSATWGEQSFVVTADPMVFNGTLPDAYSGQAYEANIFVQGYFVPPVTVDAGSIPTWMTATYQYGAGSVEFTATAAEVPTTAQTFNFTPTVTDSSTPTPRTATGNAQSVEIIVPLITWTDHTPPVDIGQDPRRAFGNSRVVLVKSAGEFPTPVLVSTDYGSSWTSASLPTSMNGQQVSGVVYGAGVFVAFTASSLNYATSPDGLTWTARTFPTGQKTFGDLLFANGLFVLPVYSAYVGTPPNGSWSPVNYLYTSSDGITWTSRTLPSTTHYAYAIYGNGTFFVRDDNTVGGTYPVAKSTDGVTWTADTSLLPWTNAIYTSQFVTTYGSGLRTSADALTWAAAAALPSVQNFQPEYIAYNGTVYLVTGGLTATYIASTDLATWRTGTGVSGGLVENAVVADGRFIAANHTDVQVGVTTP